MENTEVPAGFPNKPLTHKHLLVFSLIFAAITIIAILLLLKLPAVSKLLQLNKAVSVDDKGISALTISSDSLVENLNADLLDGYSFSDFLFAEETAADSALLAGYNYAYFLNASNINGGILGIDFLPNLSSLYLPIDGTAADSLKLGGEGPSFYLNASNLNAGTISLGLLPGLSGTYLPLSGGTLSGILDLGGLSIDSLGYITFSDGSIQSTAQATPVTYVICASDSNNTGRCDYVADGTADNVEIQEAIDDLPSDGGRVVLLEGNYYIATPVDLRSNLEISGMKGTKLHLTVRTNFFRWDENALGVHQTDPYTTIPLSDIYIHDMELDGSKSDFSSPSASDADAGKASAIKIFNSSRLHFARLYIHDMEASYAILLKGRVYPGFDSGATDVFVHDSIFVDIGDADQNNGAVYSDYDNTVIQSNIADTIKGNGFNIDVAQEGVIRDNIIKNIITTFEGYPIVTGYNAKNIIIAGNTITNSSRGIANNIGVVGGSASDNHIIVNNILQDSPGAVDYAIKLQNSGHIVKGNRIRNWDADAINLAGVTNSVIGENVINDITSGFGVGINISTGVKDVTIENNTIYDLGTVAQKGWGIRILAAGDVTGVAIRGNRVFDSGAGVQDYGIFLQVLSATSEVQIEGNYLEGNVSAALSPTSALSPTVKAIRNRGFVTENSGTATIASGLTFVNVSHGLGVTPGAKDIQVTPTNNLGSAIKFWISDFGTSTFRINVSSDPGASTATFSWSAAMY